MIKKRNYKKLTDEELAELKRMFRESSKGKSNEELYVEAKPTNDEI